MDPGITEGVGFEPTLACARWLSSSIQGADSTVRQREPYRVRPCSSGGGKRSATGRMQEMVSGAPRAWCTLQGSKGGECSHPASWLILRQATTRRRSGGRELASFDGFGGYRRTSTHAVLPTVRGTFK